MRAAMRNGAGTSKRVVEFDIDRYLRSSKKVDLSMVDWADVPSHRLGAGEVMCLHYMMDIETHTVIYLRDLLATRAALDPHVTAFLACWVYEELWHGEAFSEFLRAYGIEVPAEPRLHDGSASLPSRPSRTQRLREQMGIGHKLSLLPSLLGSMAMRDFIALHMTWGAINELTTLTAYHQLIRRSRHPVLHAMLGQVIQDERRHFAFYRAQARARLDGSRMAQRAVRTGLRLFWTPVGAGVKSQEEVDSLTVYLFGDSAEGRQGMRDIDRAIAALPGLEGMRLLEDHLDGALDRWERRRPHGASRFASERGSATAPSCSTS
jgi:rubrerythrin